MDKEKAIEAARALVKEIENPPCGKYRDPCWRNVDELEEFKSLKEALEGKPSRSSVSIEQCRGLAAQCWAKPSTQYKLMDVELAEEFARLLYRCENKGEEYQGDKPSHEDLIACLERLHFDTEQSRVNYKHLNDKKRTWTLTRYINYNFKYEELVKKTIKENVKPECLIKAARGI